LKIKRFAPPYSAAVSNDGIAAAAAEAQIASALGRTLSGGQWAR